MGIFLEAKVIRKQFFSNGNFEEGFYFFHAQKKGKIIHCGTMLHIYFEMDTYQSLSIFCNICAHQFDNFLVIDHGRDFGFFVHFFHAFPHDDFVNVLVDDATCEHRLQVRFHFVLGLLHEFGLLGLGKKCTITTTRIFFIYLTLFLTGFDKCWVVSLLPLFHNYFGSFFSFL